MTSILSLENEILKRFVIGAVSLVFFALFAAVIAPKTFAQVGFDANRQGWGWASVHDSVSGFTCGSDPNATKVTVVLRDADTGASVNANIHLGLPGSSTAFVYNNTDTGLIHCVDPDVGVWVSVWNAPSQYQRWATAQNPTNNNPAGAQRYNFCCGWSFPNPSQYEGKQTTWYIYLIQGNQQGALQNYGPHTPSAFFTDNYLDFKGVVPFSIRTGRPLGSSNKNVTGAFVWVQGLTPGASCRPTPCRFEVTRPGGWGFNGSFINFDTSDFPPAQLPGGELVAGNYRWYAQTHESERQIGAVLDSRPISSQFATKGFEVEVPDPPDFAIAITPAVQNVTAGDSATYTVYLTSQNGFSGCVDLSSSHTSSPPVVSGGNGITRSYANIGGGSCSSTQANPQKFVPPNTQVSFDLIIDTSPTTNPNTYTITATGQVNTPLLIIPPKSDTAQLRVFSAPWLRTDFGDIHADNSITQIRSATSPVNLCNSFPFTPPFGRGCTSNFLITKKSNGAFDPDITSLYDWKREDYELKKEKLPYNISIGIYETLYQKYSAKCSGGIPAFSSGNLATIELANHVSNAISPPAGCNIVEFIQDNNPNVQAVLSHNSWNSQPYSGPPAVVFVNNVSLDIINNVRIADHTGLIFITRGQIKMLGNIANEFSEIHGMYITDGTVITNQGADPDDPLIVRGAVISFSPIGINWRRTGSGRSLSAAGSDDNKTLPSEWIVYEPKYLWLFKDLIGDSISVFSEAVP